MPLLQFREITFRYGSMPLLDAVDMQIEPGERICLLGRNGVGKTSLMRVITGEEIPNQGEVIRSGSMVITRLNQEVTEEREGAVIEVIRSGLRPDLHEEEWETDQRLEELMAEMQLPLEQNFIALSGGLKRRALLARALAGQPDLLLLDEPTNHLDLESILWLEQFLLNHKELTLFFITHDRAFLRKLATRIMELDRGRLTSWNCDYDTYLQRKTVVLEAEEKQWASFDKKLAQEEAWLRQGVKARRTRNEGRVKMLEKMRAERRQRQERQGTARIEIQTGTLSGQKVVEAENITFGYEKEKPIVKELSLTLWRGDKIGIIGPNGSGKTTLLKLLLSQLSPTSGWVKPGSKLQVVYLDQLRGQINDEKTVAQNVAGDAEMITFQGRSQHIHGYLQNFLFPTDRIRMPAKQLSGGERNRLLLARLFLQPTNVLVLDEPTNDLDAETMELLEELLVEFTGTLLLVSHDRVFLDNVVTSLLVFEGEGRVTEYTGGYEDWVRQRPQISAPQSVKQNTSKESQRTEKKSKGEKKEKNKFSNREQKELGQLPSLIEKLGQEQFLLSTRLGENDLYQNEPETVPRLKEELSQLEERIKQTYARWEELEAKRKAFEVRSN